MPLKVFKGEGAEKNGLFQGNFGQKHLKMKKKSEIIKIFFGEGP